MVCERIQGNQTESSIEGQPTSGWQPTNQPHISRRSLKIWPISKIVAVASRTFFLYKCLHRCRRLFQEQPHTWNMEKSLMGRAKNRLPPKIVLFFEITTPHIKKEVSIFLEEIKSPPRVSTEGPAWTPWRFSKAMTSSRAEPRRSFPSVATKHEGEYDWYFRRHTRGAIWFLLEMPEFPFFLCGPKII